MTDRKPQRTVCPGCLWAAWGAPDRAICSRVPCARAADARALAALRAEKRIGAQETIKKEETPDAETREAIPCR